MTDTPDTLPPGPWRIFEQPIADKEEAKREMCRMIDGTPDFQNLITYVTPHTGGLAICVNVGGKTAAASARAIATIPEREREIERLRGEKRALNDILDAEKTAAMKAIKALTACVAELEAAPSPSDNAGE